MTQSTQQIGETGHIVMCSSSKVAFDLLIKEGVIRQVNGGMPIKIDNMIPHGVIKVVSKNGSVSQIDMNSDNT